MDAVQNDTFLQRRCGISELHQLVNMLIRFRVYILENMHLNLEVDMLYDSVDWKTLDNENEFDYYLFSLLEWHQY